MEQSASFPDNARVFIYQSNRLLSENETSALQSHAAAFARQWVSHGKPVRAAAQLLNGCHLIFIADVSQSDLGGCSIDESVRFVKQCEAAFNISFFDRMTLAFETAGAFHLFHYNDLQRAFDNGLLNGSSIFFDNTVTTFGQLGTAWRIPARHSWLVRQFNFS